MSQYPSFGPLDPKGGQQPNYQQPSYQSPYQTPQGGPEYGYQAPPQGPPLSPLALISAIAGGVSLMISLISCCCVFTAPLSILGGVAAVIMGHIAMVQIDRNPGAQSGKEWAIVGLATGYPAILISLGWIFFSALQIVPAFVPR
jgi:Domain of unknown function (DUF4190)